MAYENRRLVFIIASFAFTGHAVLAQSSQVVGTVQEGRRVVLQGSLPAEARSGFDQGLVDPSRTIGPVIFTLTRTSEQQAAIDSLLAAQQDPSSSSYHKWLTPEEYADRFGLNRNDMAQIAAWITSQGLKLESSARGRNWIGFSGTAGQIAAALHTEFHRYVVAGQEHFANATEVSIPAALKPVAGGFIGLDDFRKPAPNRPFYTYPNGSHALAPGDLDTIYNVNPLRIQGIDGTGQKIVIPGVSNLNLGDIRMYRSMFNLPANDPQIVLYGPDPGFNSGGQGEGSLDVEMAGALAPNAAIVYIYSSDFSVSTVYAIDQNYAPVLSASYAGCEPANVALAAQLRPIVQQANLQGMTMVAGSGDAGAAGCDQQFVSPVAVQGLAVSVPAAFPEVTAVGGTQFNDAGGNYWGATNGVNGGSALSYIPETGWNETSLYQWLASTGGGKSILYSKPAWQAGSGVPNDNVRDVPDVALAASNAHPGYIFCVNGTCSITSGTSASTPVFSGMVALLNQYLSSKGIVAQPGLGNINPVLYRIAGSAPKAFHDITTGNNIVPCALTPDCIGGQLGYSAGVGYDLVTGLGSVDAFNLITNWDTKSGSTITIAAPASMSINDVVTLSASVQSSSDTAAPSGTISFSRNNGSTVYSPLQVPMPLGSSQLVGGNASLQLYGGELNPGPNTIIVSYSGDANLNASTTSVTITATVPSATSAVTVSVGPNPVPEQVPITNGCTWFPNIQLKEVAGVATTLTGLSLSGTNNASLIPTVFGTNIIAAHGTLQTSSYCFFGFTPGTTVVFGFSGQDAGGYQWSQQASVQLGPLERFTDIYFHGLVNGASFQQAFAPGMILSVFGRVLAASSQQAGSIPLPATLAGSSVKINNVPAPFYYASSGQLNVQIPYETQPGTAIISVTATLPSGQTQTDSSSFRVAASAPGIFVDQNNSTVPFPNGSRGGTYTLFITGEGAVKPSLATGSTPDPSTPYNQLPQPKLPVTLTIGGQQAAIAFIGIPSGLVGVTQVNFTVPMDTPLGLQPVVITVGTAASQSAYFTVQ